MTSNSSFSARFSRVRRPVVRFVTRGWLVHAPAAALSLSVFAILGLLWFALLSESSGERNNLLKDVQWAETSMSRRLQNDQQFFDRLAGAVSETGRVPTHYQTEGVTHLAGQQGLINMVWNSTDGRIIWSLPPGRTVLLSERPSAAELDRMQRLTEATSRSTYSNTYRDFAGKSYIEYHSPITRNGEFFGTVSGTYDLAVLLQNAMSEANAAKYHLAFLDGEGQIIEQSKMAGDIDTYLTQSVALTLPWRDLKLRASAYRTDSHLARVVLASISVLLLAGLALSLVMLKRHIAKRLEADLALQSSHERFTTVLDGLEAAVYVADFDTGTLLFLNGNARLTFPHGAQGGPVAALEQSFAIAPCSTFTREVLIASDEQPATMLKEEFREAAGRWYVLRAKAIRWVDGRLVRMHMAADITDRRTAEEQSRVQQQKLLQTARLLTVGEMASTLAHELNQPLAAIANYNRGTLRRLKSGQFDTQELISAMEKSSRQAERAGQVISRVRDLVRNREPRRQPMEVLSLLTDCVKLVEIEAEKASVSVQAEVQRGISHALADRIMIEQVLLNLIKNGIDAMQNTPTSARRLHISAVRGETPEHIELRVADRGAGISAEAEAELFSPFFSTKPQGMGIGLNICRSIVELHSGRLWFTRNPNGGITFRFTLSALDSATLTPPDPEPQLEATLDIAASAFKLAPSAPISSR